MELDDVCVVVPVYNEQQTVATTVSDLRQSFPLVVCVDDGSSDGSGAAAQAAGAIVITHPVNLGQGASLQTGFDFALTRTSASAVVTFDADGQHLVSDAVRLVECMTESGVDVVLASRFTGGTEGMVASKRLLLRGGVAFTRVTSRLDVTDTHNGLRALSRHALETIRIELPRMAHASELLGKIAASGLSYTEVPSTVIYTEYSRAKGQSKVNAVNILFDLAVRRLRATP